MPFDTALREPLPPNEDQPSRALAELPTYPRWIGALPAYLMAVALAVVLVVELGWHPL